MVLVLETRFDNYIVTRLIAERNGYSYGIMGKDRWKGQKYHPLIDFGEEVIGGSGPEGGPPETLPEGITNYYKEHFRRHPVTNGNVGLPDPTLLNVPDGTKIEGTMNGCPILRNIVNVSVIGCLMMKV